MKTLSLLILFLCHLYSFTPDYFENFNQNNGSYTAIPESGWAWIRPDTNGYWLTSAIRLGNINWRLFSIPFIAHRDTPTISFGHWYNIEPYQDGGNVKFRHLSDTNWTIIHAVPGLGQPYDYIVAWSGESAYSGASDTWMVNYMIIPVLSGDSFILCWHYGEDGSVSLPGWAVDNVLGIGFDAIVGIKEESIEEGMMRDISITPNPFSKEVIVKLKGKNYGDVRVKLYDLAGNLIRRRCYSPSDKSVEYSFILKRENLSSGVYFLKVQDRKTVVIRKLTIE